MSIQHYSFASLLFVLLGASPAAAATSTPSSLKAAPSTTPVATPNQAVADLAKEVLLKSLKPVYEKQENWGHQKELVAGYQWRQIDGHWQADKVTKKVNDGLWRMYRVTLENAARNLQIRFTAPRPIENGRTAFQVFLNARVGFDARQEQWTLGVKGLNFHVEGDATIAARLDVTIAVGPAKDASFGTIEVQPEVTAVNLRLVDLTLKRLDIIHGDAARELGNAFEDILAGELHRREGEVMKKLNVEIDKHRDKLRFSPSQIAEIGWEKIQSLLSAAGGAASSPAKKTP
ncbi:MAG TPA: hypothetical protein VKH44_14105 [Pirellulaceae bacterium]|nr:hypothetical protein [Pirellulaceae bacterium]